MAYIADELLMEAVACGASDVHISVNSPPIFRIHSNLIPYGDFSLTNRETEDLVQSVLRPEDWETLNKLGEIDTSYQIGDATRFRLNAFRQKQSISLAARIIPSRIPKLHELNMPSILEDLAMKPQGLILVTGPTGSGKSTTLASMLDFINRNEARHMITLEDPIEYLHKHNKSIVQQREVGLDTDTFSNGLRASLRQDPDIILVGEMRDLETISTAITAAETGHLVLATLHTNSAAQTINRIIDVFPPNQQGQIRVQLADVLQGIISQRLFPRLDGKGRIAATEILVHHPSVANLIRNSKIDQLKNVMQTSRAMGMYTLESSIKDLLNSGLIKPSLANSYLVSEGEL